MGSRLIANQYIVVSWRLLKTLDLLIEQVLNIVKNEGRLFNEVEEFCGDHFQKNSLRKPDTIINARGLPA